MRTQAEWEKRNKLIEAAGALADFANLEPGHDVSFRADHPDFVPGLWWAENWMQERDLLRKAWRAGFPGDIALKLVTSRLFGIAHVLASAGLPADIPNPSWTAQMVTDVLDEFKSRALFEKWAAARSVQTGLGPGNRLLAPDGTDITKEVKHRAESDPRVWPYQRAVLFLHIHPKQARSCDWCKKPFVGESSNARFCRYGTYADDGWDSTCFLEYRKHYKHENWSDNRDRLNEKRRLEYAAKQKRRAAKKKQKAAR